MVCINISNHRNFGLIILLLFIYFFLFSKIFALICLCICNAFAYPSNEQVTELVQPKSIVGNIVPKPGGVSSDQAPLHSLEPLAIEDEPSDGIKETLEPAASSWGELSFLFPI